MPPIIPDNDHSKATIDFGFLDVHKYYMKDGKQEPLKDAEFRIFADEKKANACAQGIKKNKELDKIHACKAASTIGDAADATTDVQTATTNDLSLIHI